MSRTALDGFPLKDFMLDLIKRFSALYFTEILGFCLMGNHFNLLVEMIPLVHSLAYIGLNPARAGLVDRPEECYWNSLGFPIQTKNKGLFLSTDFSHKEFSVGSKKSGSDAMLIPDHSFDHSPKDQRRINVLNY